MKILQKYVIYHCYESEYNETNLPSPLSLLKLRLQGGLIENAFNTEEDAIKALVEDGKFYQDFVILKHTFIEK